MPEEILYDKRLQERFIRQGLLKRKKLEEWRSQLPDLEPEAARSEIVQDNDTL